MRPPIVQHAEYWKIKNLILQMEDAISRGIESLPSESHKGEQIKGDRDFLEELYASVTEFEEKHPKII